jgi:large subunit ribosomal protein L28
MAWEEGPPLLECVILNFRDFALKGHSMAQKCEICGKGPQYGNIISHANNVRRRRWNPNLRRVRALVNGARKQLRVCTSCLRSGRVKKAA